MVGGSGRDGDGGRCSENPKIDIIQLFSLAFLKIQSVEYFGKENTPTGFQLVLVSYSFSGPFLQLGTAMRV
jgi:hypothetical protein